VHVTTIAVDSPLGRWTHSECAPAHLAHAVERLWHFEGRTAEVRERAFPGGYLELILHLGPRYHDVDARGERAAAFPEACIAGLQTRSFVIAAPTAPCCVLGVRLRPAGAYALLGRALHETTGLTVSLADLVGADADRLTDGCLALASASDRLVLAASWLAARRARPARPDQAIAWAAARLERRHGAVSILELRDQAGMTRTRFTATFREQIGLSPKRYARVLRFRRALELLHAGRGPADVALATGYFDQPHMNGDFREFAGMPPSAFASAARYPNSVSVAEPG
jgi:AraC-like DNA-binding protein